MQNYEHIILARPDIPESQITLLIKDFKKVIEDEKGKIEKIENWGLRNITYKIKKNRKAHYILMNIKCAAATIIELKRQQLINEDILRIITIKVNKFEENQSAIFLSKNEKKLRR